MSTIPIQNLIIDNDTDIGLTSDLINGTFKSSSLTDLSNNVYSKITDLSSNLNSKISSKQNTLKQSQKEKALLPKDRKRCMHLALYNLAQNARNFFFFCLHGYARLCNFHHV